MTDLQLALAHYAIQFPDLASLGAGSPPATWKTEYDRVMDTAFAPVLVTGTGSEGSNVNASRNFDQKTLLHALHVRRNQLDETYTAPFAAPPVKLGRRVGFQVQLDQP